MKELLEYFFLPLLGALSAALVVVTYLQIKQRSALSKPIELVTIDIRGDSGPGEYEKSLAKYFSSMGSYVRRARKEILILDYLAHHRAFTVHGKELFASYERYFRTIEEQVLRNKLTYTRIMQLPLGESHDLPRQKLQEVNRWQQLHDLNRQQLIDKCVDLMFVETLAHVKRLYEHDCNFNLYIIGVPLRQYSYIIVDGKYLLSEYDRYNKAGFSLPDHLIIDRADSGNPAQDATVLQLIEHHTKQIHAVISHKKPILLEELREAVSRLESREIKKFEVSLQVDDLVEFLEKRMPNESDLEVRPRVPEQVEQILKGYEKKQSVFSAPSSGRGD